MGNGPVSKVHPSPDFNKMNSGGFNSGHLQAGKHNMTTEYQETDEDREFLDMVDIVDVERSHLENALEKMEELSFDAFTFCSILPGHGIQYLMYKICQMYNLFNTFHFNSDKLLNFTNEVRNTFVDIYLDR